MISAEDNNVYSIADNEYSYNKDTIYEANYRKNYTTEKLKTNYHKQRLSQSRLAFWLSFFGSICGFFHYWIYNHLQSK